MKVLITDKLSESGLVLFRKAKGIEVVYEPDLGKDIAKLKKMIIDVDAVAIRSETKLTADILACAKNLKLIGRAGIGVDNVDMAAASKKGIIVMNTPRGNMVTTAEHAISMMCALTRNIPQATASLKSGKWEKGKFLGSELYQKTLGIIGCGNIGKIVANLAQGFNMKVVSYDPFLTDEVAKELGIEKVAFDELLQTSDYISIHTPLNEKTRNMINKTAFKKMKKGVYLINCARGGIVRETDLLSAIEDGIVAGAALDVFETEPVNPDNKLLKSDKVICTPHLGAATEEAQENVAIDVANQIVDYLLYGNIVNAVNTASASAEALRLLGPFMKLGQKLGSIHGQLCHESPYEIQINYYGDIIVHNINPVTTSVLQGILQHMLSDVHVNNVNAPYLAKERGIKVQETKINKHKDYSSLIEIGLEFTDHKKTIVSGCIFGKNNPRLVRYNDIYTEVNPHGQILIIENRDVPGVVGKIGTFLGQHQVNISNMQLGLSEKTGMATAFYSIQGKITQEIFHGIKKMDGITSIDLVEL